MEAISNTQIRLLMLYEFKLGSNASETARKINMAFGESTAVIRTVQRWFQKFVSGDFNLEGDYGTGRPTTLDNDVLKNAVEADPCKTTRELASELGIDHSTVIRHLKEIGKVKKMDKWVPHELTEKNRFCRMEISTSLLLRNNSDPFLNRILTCDEKWILYDNRKRSAQWLDKSEAPNHAPKPNLHQKKVMITVWWTMEGLVHMNFLKPGESITAEKYCSELDVVRQKLAIKQPSLVNRKGVLLLHDNARPHVSRMTFAKLQEIKFETIPHPAYSPDLSPTDYHFFKHLDHYLKQKKFSDQLDIENAIQQFIDSRTPDFFKSGIEKLISRWKKCVESNGDYFD